MLKIKNLLIILLIYYINENNVNCANILGLMGVASPSHQLWNSVLINGLANRGHNITVLTVDLPKNPKEIPKNVHYIHLEETYKSLYETGGDDKLSINDYIGVGPLNGIPIFYDFGHKTAIGIFKSKGLDTLLNYPDNFKFDLVLHDYTVGSYLLGFLHKFKYPPLIGITAFHNPPLTVDIVGGHYFPGYIPFHGTIFDTHMTFYERMVNNFVYMVDTLYRRYIDLPKLEKIMRTKFPPDTPYIGDLEKKHILALVNSHPAVNYPEPMPPNVIEIGGMQLIDPQPLPKDLEEFIQQSINGSILFSLGTNMKPTDLGEERIQIIIDTMTSLPQYNFMWKFQKDFIKTKLPNNLLIKEFFPQRDILAHPKLKAFVTHAGGLSTQEATWRGVPMIGLALFVDQPRNLHKSIISGVAERVDYLTLSIDSLRSTILKVCEDPKYDENMKIRSARFRDRPMKPLDTAIWWVEYVLRHPKPDHLQSPVVDIGFLAGNSIDFVLVLLAGIIFSLYIICKVLRLISKLLFSKKSVDMIKKNK